MKCWPLFLLLAAAPALAQTTFSEERLLPVQQDRDAYTPHAAASSDGFLVVWQSGRFAPGDLRGGLKTLAAADIVGLRLNKDGTSLDSSPLVLCAAPDMQTNPRAAFGGGVFLVVWQDMRAGRDWDVFGTRVSTSGEVLDPQGIEIASGQGNQALPDVVFNGEDFVVVWQDFRSGKNYELFGARVTPQGAVREPQGASLDSDLARSAHLITPALASSGAGKAFVLYGVMVWSGATWNTPPARGLFLDGITPGTRTSYQETNYGPGRNAVPIALAAGSGGFFAVWRTDATAGRGDVPNAGNAMVMDGAGLVSKRFFIGGSEKRIQSPGACHDGSRFRAVWQETDTTQTPFHLVRASAVNIAGDLVEAAVTLSGDANRPAAAPQVACASDGTVLVVYERHPDRADTPIAIATRYGK